MADVAVIPSSHAPHAGDRLVSFGMIHTINQDVLAPVASSQLKQVTKNKDVPKPCMHSTGHVTVELNPVKNMYLIGKEKKRQKNW